MHARRADGSGSTLMSRDVRERLESGASSRLPLRVKSSVVGVADLDKLFREVTHVFEEKFKGWREEDHEAFRFLERLVK